MGQWHGGRWVSRRWSIFIRYHYDWPECTEESFGFCILARHHACQLFRHFASKALKPLTPGGFWQGEDSHDNHCEDPHDEEGGLLGSSRSKAVAFTHPSTPTWLTSFMHNFRRARGLFLPYMLPLLLVYIAEYTINLGLFPVLLFPLKSTPFTEYRSFYPFYSFLYQVGTQYLSPTVYPVSPTLIKHS